LPVATKTKGDGIEIPGEMSRRELLFPLRQTPNITNINNMATSCNHHISTT